MVAVLPKKMADRITQLQDAVNSVGHFICLLNILLKENLICCESLLKFKVGVVENMYLILKELANHNDVKCTANKLGPR